MSDEVSLCLITAITIVLLSLILWGCDANRESEITERIIATNGVVKEVR